MLTAAAPVSYPVANGGFWHVVRLSWLAASSGCAVAWLAWHLGGTPVVQALLAALGVGLVLGLNPWWRSLQPQPAGECLQWTGEQWRLGGQDADWRLQVGLDLGPQVLVKATSASSSATRWLPLSARDAPADWPRLRQALHARQAAGQGSPGEPPAGAAA